MDRDQLSNLSLQALRELASQRGIASTANLARAELIERLTPRTLVERAKEVVARAAEAVENKAHALADKLGSQSRPDDRATLETTDERVAIPSSTVHPRPPTPMPAEPGQMLDFAELPETYGVDECAVLFKNPFWVFAYWEVTEAGMQAARAQLGESARAARPVLRLFTTVANADGVERDIRDVDLTTLSGRQYLRAPRAGAHLRIAIGLLSSEGYFAPITHSSLIRVPPHHPSPGPVEWMEVVPAKTRGRLREPIVMVRRSGHAERGHHYDRSDEQVGGDTSPRGPFGGSSPVGRRSPGSQGS
jgi:hypothetical protein